MTLHALQHLPDQVRKFGPLHRVSAMPFENLNRQLKRSITGTHGSAAQMVHRYISTQATICVEERISLVPTVLGKVARYKRFKVCDLVFHATDHGKRLKCASY